MQLPIKRDMIQRPRIMSLQPDALQETALVLSLISSLSLSEILSLSKGRSGRRAVSPELAEGHVYPVKPVLASVYLGTVIGMTSRFRSMLSNWSGTTRDISQAPIHNDFQP